MSVRDDAARARDAAATARDAAADARDATMRRLDLENGQGGFPRSAVNALLRAAAQRKRAAEQRDLAALVREVVLAATDPLTGARMRGSGLTNLANEIDRCRRTGQRLVVIYIDTVGSRPATTPTATRRGTHCCSAWSRRSGSTCGPTTS